jgi:hypothetical protein
MNLQVDYYGGAFLVKRDGTLWRLGNTNVNLKSSEPWPDLRSLNPYRLGTESNWVAVLRNDAGIAFRKSNGTLWSWDIKPMKNAVSGSLDMGSGNVFHKLDANSERLFRGTIVFWGGVVYGIGIADDGTFRIYADQHRNQRLGDTETAAERLPGFRIGTESNWLAVVGARNQAVTLKNDGSLWEWDFTFKNEHSTKNLESDESEMLKRTPKRLGTHSDWVALADASNQINGIDAVIALAADGGLWYWPLKREYYSNSDGTADEPLLSLSLKPQLLANIFDPAAVSAR